ncbi:uncharacterized protein LOC112516372 [Cynara cardunculus var. scolymus]|uniref:Non-heme dioxygenase N-terminal domain-containing protein n=1 Tax=Cynara cardunculus var. scolymus TaxID=59895 RepID=A0A103XLP7_CYNCS|nr:uncharacterized protein LOC112516372 [Cynara cardunculus var. scolymus]KVH92993.1 Non-heme dioxygenase N-terminal domain-containing protein [Cynara cardunculus var. scolymus]
MANWPESFQHKPLQFRAPPPSPVASGRRSSVTNDEILTEFLHRSLSVPDLVLPDRLQKSKVQNLPKLDYKLLQSLEGVNVTDILDLISRTGCFQLVNHGISNQLVRSAANYGAEIFELSPEKKAFLLRSADRMYGFVEFNGEEKETSEEFVWCRDDALRSKMEEALQNSHFSVNLEILTSVIEKIAEIILKFLSKNGPPKSGFNDDEGASEKQTGGSICYVHRHNPDLKKFQSNNHHTNSMRYDMIRMLIRGSEHSHTLCLHVCHGSSEFHVYSKKGWVTFLHEKDALVITIGDLLKKWSKGKCKHVMGMPLFKGEEDHISMAFLYNSPSPPIPINMNKKMTISIGQQVLLILTLTLFYMILL